MGIQQLMLGVGAGKKTYLDDVFSTYVYRGDDTQGSTKNNGIDLSGEGGLVWLKSRSNGRGHLLYDTERGATKYIESSGTSAESTASTLGVVQFNNNGFNLGSHDSANDSSHDHVSWTFRKSPMFDVVTWTGNSSTTQTISHSLGSIPGCIFAKSTSNDQNWGVYHRGLDSGNQPETHYLLLNNNTSEVDDAGFWADTAPTATTFVAGSYLNNDGWTYVAYVFAGGESTAATARSVALDGTGDYLSLASSSDLAMGTGDFTVEGWFKVNSGSNFAFWMNGASGLGSDLGVCVWYYSGSSYGLTFNNGTDQATNVHPPKGQWFHLAYVRSSGTTSLYYNGELIKSVSNTIDYTNQTFVIGGYASTSYLMDGSVSNFRVVKGTAVYTSSFRPPTEPLTNITNTKLLCCNNSSTTGSTVTPGTITANGDPTASTDSPFDDPAGFKFGDSKEGIIKCGSYVGNGSSTGPEINLGFEPQWWLVKRTDSSANWQLLDSMRGWVNGSNDQYLAPNTTSSEGGYAFGHPTSTGFVLDDAHAAQNADGGKYVYMALRRPDGYVGKPADAGTDVFAVDVGNSTNNSYTPSFDSTFYPDFGMLKHQTNVEDWHVSARLMDQKYIKTNSSAAQAGADYVRFDLENGWATGWGSSHIGYMFKRHAGMDVVAWSGDDVAGRDIRHNLNAVPEMIWVKNRSSAEPWAVYHHGANGGTNPWNYYAKLNETSAFSSSPNMWDQTAPTSTHFRVIADNMTNGAGSDYIAMLFDSVDGISKVGSYSGVSNNANLTIDLGFVPRLFIHKRVDSGCNSESRWYIWDSNRGMGSSGTEKPFFLNSNAAEGNAYDYVATVNSGGVKGITLTGGVTSHFLGNNPSTEKYIYYAHA